MKKQRLAFLIFNVLGLQLTWAACAYGAVTSFPLLGAYVGGAYIVLHMMLTPARTQDITIMLVLTSIGVVLDYLNMQLGVISFNNNSQFIPIWLVFLWCVFSLMIPHSLHWLSNKPKLAILLGGFGGSSSYWMGHKLGAITLNDPMLANVAIYFIQWAIYFPIAYIIFRYIQKSITSRGIEISSH